MILALDSLVSLDNSEREGFKEGLHASHYGTARCLRVRSWAILLRSKLKLLVRDMYNAQRLHKAEIKC
jgi:hypothetical protein